MNYLNALPPHRPLLDQIGALETSRERLRDLGRLTPFAAKQIAEELKALRSQLAVERQTEGGHLMLTQLPLFTSAPRPAAPPAPPLEALALCAAALGYLLDGPRGASALYRLSPLGPAEAHVAAESPYCYLRESLGEVADLLDAIADGRQARTSAEMGGRLRAQEDSR